MRSKQKQKNIEQMAEDFLKRNKLRYCKHWNGHFCEICADADLVRLLQTVFLLGKASMSQEIFSSVTPARARAERKEAGDAK